MLLRYGSHFFSKPFSLGLIFFLLLFYIVLYPMLNYCSQVCVFVTSVLHCPVPYAQLLFPGVCICYFCFTLSCTLCSTNVPRYVYLLLLFYIVLYAMLNYCSQICVFVLHCPVPYAQLLFPGVYLLLLFYIVLYPMLNYCSQVCVFVTYVLHCPVPYAQLLFPGMCICYFCFTLSCTLCSTIVPRYVYLLLMFYIVLYPMLNYCSQVCVFVTSVLHCPVPYAQLLFPGVCICYFRFTLSCTLCSTIVPRYVYLLLLFYIVLYPMLNYCSQVCAFVTSVLHCPVRYAQLLFPGVCICYFCFTLSCTLCSTIVLRYLYYAQYSNHHFDFASMI